MGFDFDLAKGQGALRANAATHLQVGVTLKLTLGIDLEDLSFSTTSLLNNFFIRDAHLNGTVNFAATNINAEGDFGVLKVAIVGGSASANVALAITLNDPNGDGRITLNEIISNPGAVLGTPGLTGSATFDLPIAVTFNVPNVALSGNLRLAIDARDLTAPLVSITGTGATLNVAGQVLTGNFVVERITTAAGAAVDRVGISNATLSIGSGVVNATITQGLALVTASSVGASFTGSAAFAVPGFSISVPSVQIEINSGAAAIHDTFTIANPGTVVTLNLPAGPYIRVVAVVAASSPVDIAGNRLSGTFAFDQQTRAGPDGAIDLASSTAPVNADNEVVTRIVLSDVKVTLSGSSDPILAAGTGAFVIKPTGVAGFLSGTAALASSGISVGGSVLLRVNKTGHAVDEVITVNGANFVIRFREDEGNVFAISVTALSLDIGGVLAIEGSVSFSTATLSDASTAQTFAGEGLRVFVGDGPYTLANAETNPLARGLLLSDARIGLVRDSGANAGAGAFGLDATGALQVLGRPNAAVAGTARVRLNSFTKALDEAPSICSG